MSFKLLNNHLKPAEDERTVRTYHCTSLSSLFLSLEAKGYLTVTNMRVVFYAHGSSYGGTSVMHSEVPIADVSGIDTYKGSYFSISHLLSALVISFIIGGVATTIGSAIVGLIVSLVADSANASQVVLTVIGLIVLLYAWSYAKDNLRKPIFASSAATLIAGPGIFSTFVSLLGGSSLNLILSILAFIISIYALVTMFWYARRETMSLTIGSKGGSYTPIAISGISVLGIFNTAAVRALTAEPAWEAETMIKELGALITDIQTLGNEAIPKWRKLG